jgi:hypothetical protein
MKLSGGHPPEELDPEDEEFDEEEGNGDEDDDMVRLALGDCL